jgi:hypothetical protein
MITAHFYCLMVLLPGLVIRKQDWIVRANILLGLDSQDMDKWTFRMMMIMFKQYTS